MWQVIASVAFGRAGDLAFDAGATRVMRKTKPAVYWCERLVAR